MTISIQDFLVARKNLPVVDARSEGEFAQGHVVGAINIPLLNNEERIAVGTDYKQKGQAEAIRTGFRLVGPRVHTLVDAAVAIAIDNELLVHCWRGGMRSGNFCKFVSMAGIKTRSLAGGYKAYRQLALDTFNQPLHLTLLTGYTGSGKSDILRALKNNGEQVIDLEALASHKGSAFGALLQPPQPTTEQFQNDLFEQLLTFDSRKRIWVEDESLAIGKIFLPSAFWRQMKDSNLIRVELAREVRIDRLVKEYGEAATDDFLPCLINVQKRLGGQDFKQAVEKLMERDMPAVMDVLLTYYDKAYAKTIDRRKKRIRASLEWDGTDMNQLIEKLKTYDGN